MARIYRREDYSNYDLENILQVVDEFHHALADLCDANIAMFEFLCCIPYRRFNICF